MNLNSCHAITELLPPPVSQRGVCGREKNIDQPFPDGDGEERRDRAASYPAGGPANVRVRNRASPSPTMATGRTCHTLPAFEALS